MPRQFKLKLTHKALIIAAIPLILGVSFVGVLTYLLHQAESDLQDEHRNVMLFTDLEQARSIIMNEVGYLALYGFSGSSHFSESQFENLKSEARRSFARARENCGDDQQLAQETDSIKAIGHLITAYLDESKSLIKAGGKLFAPLRVAELRRQATNSMENFGRTLDRIGDLVERKRSATRARQALYRSLIVTLLQVAVAGSIVLSVAIALALTRGAVRRVRIITDNAQRFSLGQSLNPLLPGDDEIADLDAVFHTMASSLSEASRKEREAQDMRDRLMAMISHDIRTPLTAINAILSLVEAGAFGMISGEGLQSIGMAKEENRLLIKLFNDLLHAKKSDILEFALTLSTVNLSDLLQRSALTVGQIASQRGISITVPQTNAVVIADADRLAQVMINLLGNAEKYSPDGAEITVSVKQLDDWIEVSVADRGPGIPQGWEEKVFEPFAQADGNSTAASKGAGLGLAICRTIVLAHGGFISANNAKEGGAVISFRLPLARAEGAVCG